MLSVLCEQEFPQDTLIAGCKSFLISYALDEKEITLSGELLLAYIGSSIKLWIAYEVYRITIFLAY